MSNEIKNTNAIELSSEELDMVAGGNGDSFSLGVSGSKFEQIAIAGCEATFASPKGAGTQEIVQIQSVSSKAFKG